MFNSSKMTWKIVEHDISNTVTLVCKVKGGTLDYGAAQRLLNSNESLFLPFRYEESKKKNCVTFYYDATGCIPVETSVKAHISLSQYCDLVANVADVTDLCTRLEVFDSYLQWDFQKIWWSPSHNALRFVVVPVHMEHKTRPLTPFDFLAFLSSPDAVVFDSEYNVAALHTVDDYLRRTTVFSSMSLRSFVDKNLRVLASSVPSSAQQQLQAALPVNNPKATGILNPVVLVREDVKETPAIAHTQLAVEPAFGHRYAITRTRDGKRFEWEKPVVTLGRSYEADICVEDNPCISNLHLQISPNSFGGFTILDLGSTNGTRVAEILLSAGQYAHIRPGETFEIVGDYFFFEIVS